MSDNLTDKLSDNLRNLLIDNDDLAERLCAMGSTSHAESNHARIVRRGYHVKGILSEFWPFLTSFDLDLGDPINIESNHFEAKLALASITHNAGYSGLRELSQNTNPVATSTLVKRDDDRTRRSRDNMVETKKKKIQKLKNQKQFTSKAAGLSTYKGDKATANTENTAPSKTFLCTKARKLSLDQ